MKNQFKNIFNKPKDYPQVVERVGRSYNWRVILLSASLVAVFFLLPLLYEFISKQIELAKQTEVLEASKEKKQEIPESDHPATFDEILDTALRYDRQGNRKQAEILFNELMRQAARNTNYVEQMVVLFPRAADFYSKGNEIPAKEVENLYLDALDAIKHFHGNDYYDYENIYLGLEKHYISQGRHKEAATQIKYLLEFYKRYYKNKDTQYSFIQPTTIRLGHTLLAAGQNIEARNVYKTVLEMAKTKGRSVSIIEKFIKNTYQNEQAPPSSINGTPRVPASIGANLSLVRPSSIIETPRVPASIDANISPAPAPSSTSTGKDTISAIKALSQEGVYIEQLQEKDDRINIIGYAADNKTIARYMRLIHKEVGEPTLNLIKQEEREQKKVSAFSIAIKK